MLPTHAEPTPELSAAALSHRRAVLKRAADLCRSQPAVFAAVVRRSDVLVVQGVDPLAAQDQALSERGV